MTSHKNSFLVKYGPPEHLDTAMKSPNRDVRRIAIGSHSATEAHVEAGLNDRDPYVKMSAAASPVLTQKTAMLALKDPNQFVGENAMRYIKNLSKELIDAGMAHHAEEVRTATISRPEVSREHLEAAIKDPSRSVRSAAVSHPKATKDVLEAGLNDPEHVVRVSANNELKRRK